MFWVRTSALESFSRRPSYNVDLLLPISVKVCTQPKTSKACGKRGNFAHLDKFLLSFHCSVKILQHVCDSETVVDCQRGSSSRIGGALHLDSPPTDSTVC